MGEAGMTYSKSGEGIVSSQQDFQYEDVQGQGKMISHRELEGRRVDVEKLKTGRKLSLGKAKREKRNTVINVTASV